MSIQIGDATPDFTVKNQFGQEVTLSSFKGKKNVVLTFYPFSFTGTCTGELCDLRDNLAVFQNDNVELLAISCDSPFTQKVFAEKENYSFNILADFWPHGAVARAYGVFDEEKGCAIRGTFIINKEGKLTWSVINGIGEGRNFHDYQAALAKL
jgi:peroxiredoxin